MAPKNNDDIVDIVKDFIKDDSSFLVKKLAELKKLPPSKQFGTSALIGLGSGFVVGKVGRVVVYTALASGVLTYFAQKYGYVKINFDALQDDYELCKEGVESSINNYVPNLLKSSVKFSKNNLYITTGTILGFLIGLDISHF